MEVRCQNCHAHLSVPSVGSLKKTQCPNCGTMVSLSPVPVEAHHHHSARRERRAFRRIFEPIPRAATYAGGLLLILLLLSPFWLSWLVDLSQRRPVFLAETTAPATNSTTVAGRDLTLFAGVRLESRREELEHPFGLILQNTRGMQPEIYAGRRTGDIELMLAYCYDGILKEVAFVMRSRPVPPEVIEQELVGNFGEPQTRTDENGDVGRLGLTGLRLDVSKDEVASTLASFQHRRALLWTDGKERVDAVIYFNDSGPGPSSVMLQVHLAATEWLQANQPTLKPVGLRHE